MLPLNRVVLNDKAGVPPSGSFDNASPLQTISPDSAAGVGSSGVMEEELEDSCCNRHARAGEIENEAYQGRIPIGLIA